MNATITATPENDNITPDGLPDVEPPTSLPRQDAFKSQVARRPANLLAPEDALRLSVRSDVIGLIYITAHLGLIAAGGWLCWATWGSAAFWPIFAVHAFIVGSYLSLRYPRYIIT